MGKKLEGFAKYDDYFYGVTLRPDRVKGLVCVVMHGVKGGEPYAYVTFSDDEGVKWKIIPTLSKKGNVQSLNLHHRSGSSGKKFHSQNKRAWGTRGGLAELIDYIADHEVYEHERDLERHGTRQDAPQADLGTIKKRQEHTLMSGLFGGYGCAVCGWHWETEVLQSECPGVPRYQDYTAAPDGLYDASTLERAGYELSAEQKAKGCVWEPNCETYVYLYDIEETTGEMPPTESVFLELARGHQPIAEPHAAKGESGNKGKETPRAALPKAEAMKAHVLTKQENTGRYRCENCHATWRKAPISDCPGVPVYEDYTETPPTLFNKTDLQRAGYYLAPDSKPVGCIYLQSRRKYVWLYDIEQAYRKRPTLTEKQQQRLAEGRRPLSERVPEEPDYSPSPQEVERAHAWLSGVKIEVFGLPETRDELFSRVSPSHSGFMAHMRHEKTNYDDLLDDMSQQRFEADVYQSLKSAVHAAIHRALEAKYGPQ